MNVAPPRIFGRVGAGIGNRQARDRAVGVDGHALPRPARRGTGRVLTTACRQGAGEQGNGGNGSVAHDTLLASQTYLLIQHHRDQAGASTAQLRYSGNVRIDVWSDIVCPWCYVGKRRLE